MMIKKNRLIFIFIFFCFALVSFYCEKADSTNNPQHPTENETVEKLKELTDFAKWPGKNGPVRDGLNLSKYAIPSLSDAIEEPKNIPRFSAREITPGEILVQYRSKWELSPQDFLSITLTFANTCEEAHEYLIERFFNSSMPFEGRVHRRDLPVKAGDLSFDDGRYFIRNNIIVEFHGVGTIVEKITQAAKEVDNLLLARSTAVSTHPFRPVIKQFAIEDSVVKNQSFTKLIIDASDPQGSELYYLWRLTGGGIEKDDSGNYMYYADREHGSTQKITLIVVNDRGYRATAAVDVSID